MSYPFNVEERPNTFAEWREDHRHARAIAAKIFVVLLLLLGLGFYLFRPMPHLKGKAEAALPMEVSIDGIVPPGSAGDQLMKQTSTRHR